MKKRIAGLVLAATLVTGLGGFGTYSYFSDSAVVQDKVNIVTGKFDIDANWEEGSQWNYVGNNFGVDTLCIFKPNNKPNTGSDNGLSFENVKPGDVFERTIVVKNVGTLDADTTVQLADAMKNCKVSKNFNVTITPVNGTVSADNVYKNVINKDKFLTYKISLELKVGSATEMTGEDLGYNTTILEGKALDFVKVNAVQTNNKEAQPIKK